MKAETSSFLVKIIFRCMQLPTVPGKLGLCLKILPQIVEVSQRYPRKSSTKSHDGLIGFIKTIPSMKIILSMDQQMDIRAIFICKKLRENTFITYTVKKKSKWRLFSLFYLISVAVSVMKVCQKRTAGAGKGHVALVDSASSVLIFY